MKSFEYLVQNYSCKYSISIVLSLPVPFCPLPDVPGYSTRASPLHPGQQLCRGTRLDRHPDQSQPVQPQTLKHLPSFSLPQRPLALLQAVSRRRPWVYALHWVRKVFFNMCPASCACPFLSALSFFRVHLFSAVSRQTSSWM